MPLIKSGSRKAVGANISEMEHSGRPHNQAVAAALSNARKYGAKFADGGPSWAARTEARGLVHQGMIHSPVPGRTDRLPIGVGGGAYVLPADHVSALGQNNSAGGADVLNHMFRMGPYGTSAGKTPGIKNPKMAPMKMSAHARGGAAHVPIIAAGGEFVIPPEKIIEHFGSLKTGHAALDKWVVNTRKKHVKTLSKLPGPKK